jgi:hypothetical protein
LTTIRRGIEQVIRGRRSKNVGVERKRDTTPNTV